MFSHYIVYVYRSPLVHDMTNVSKEKALSKRLSMKLGKGNSNALPVAKPNERRSSSGFRDLFHKLRRRSNSRERVPERRSTVSVVNNLFTLCLLFTDG